LALIVVACCIFALLLFAAYAPKGWLSQPSSEVKQAHGDLFASKYSEVSKDTAAAKGGGTLKDQKDQNHGCPMDEKELQHALLNNGSSRDMEVEGEEIHGTEDTVTVITEQHAELRGNGHDRASVNEADVEVDLAAAKAAWSSTPSFDRGALAADAPPASPAPPAAPAATTTLKAVKESAPANKKHGEIIHSANGGGDEIIGGNGGGADGEVTGGGGDSGFSDDGELDSPVTTGKQLQQTVEKKSEQQQPVEPVEKKPAMGKQPAQDRQHQGLVGDDWFQTGPAVTREEEAAAAGGAERSVRIDPWIDTSAFDLPPPPSLSTSDPQPLPHPLPQPPLPQPPLPQGGGNISGFSDDGEIAGEDSGFSDDGEAGFSSDDDDRLHADTEDRASEQRANEEYRLEQGRIQQQIASERRKLDKINTAAMQRKNAAEQQRLMQLKEAQQQLGQQKVEKRKFGHQQTHCDPTSKLRQNSKLHARAQTVKVARPMILPVSATIRSAPAAASSTAPAAAASTHEHTAYLDMSDVSSTDSSASSADDYDSSDEDEGNRHIRQSAIATARPYFVP
jgi:hypothetical protein